VDFGISPFWNFGPI